MMCSAHKTSTQKSRDNYDLIFKDLTMHKAPYYDTPDDTVCPDCGEQCEIIPVLNEFAYAGTHCTHGRSGTHYPDDWGSLVSDCCEVPVEI